MSRVRRLFAAIAALPRAFWDWQSEIPDQGRVTLVGLLLLAIGSSAWCEFFGVPPLAALSLPGLVLVAVGLGFTMRRGGAG